MNNNNILMTADTTKATFPFGAELNIPLKTIPEELTDIENQAIEEQKECYYENWKEILSRHGQRWSGQQIIEPYLYIDVPSADSDKKIKCYLCIFFCDLQDKALFDTASIDIDLQVTEELRNVIADAVRGMIK